MENNVLNSAPASRPNVDTAKYTKRTIPMVHVLTQNLVLSWITMERNNWVKCNKMYISFATFELNHLRRCFASAANESGTAVVQSAAGMNDVHLLS